ncbi:helix-turn-helix domain-containing protein [Limosilactobacillus sp. STM2_1]|uniref:Helix-turn-helix domain-containing protein n=1 Tax=Limosilactobacillus rudii TaxID=2759755 RepID=A0A7W3YNU4_9LACO|nr:helix-turn-helix domain-containing protein [Limosilactobacillus rudii]MBB1098523.1 helix-turn-helix domain-containing protein [Limosilactobacillus rudii]
MERAIARDYAIRPNEELGLTSVGRSDTMPEHKYGPAVRPYYLIHYILAGSGTFKVNNIAYHLHAGQGFLIEPNYRTTYVADKETPWSYVWLGFAGKSAATWINQLNISETSPVFNSTESYELADCVNKILALDNLAPANNLRAISYLFRFLSYIARGTVANVQQVRPKQNYYVTEAIQNISHHVTTVTVDNLAQAININRSYLTALFKRNLDLTPSEYIRNFRITKARHLLESSDTSIDQVAEQCGYQHLNSFTRVFKQTYGISPRQYRQQSKIK